MPWDINNMQDITDITTDVLAYSDTLGNSEKCHCNQMASYCVTVTGVTVSEYICITNSSLESTPNIFSPDQVRAAEGLRAVPVPSEHGAQDEQIRLSQRPR